MIEKISRYQLSRDFLEFERDNNLLLHTIDTVYVWQVVRVWIFLELLGMPNAVNEGSLKGIFLTMVSKFKRIVSNTLLRNPFFYSRKNEVIFFQSSRRYPINNEYIDIYTHYLIEEMRNEGVNVGVYETVIENLAPSNKPNALLSQSCHIDFLNICSKIVARFCKYNISSNEIQYVYALERKLNKKFGTELDLLAIFRDAIRSFKSQFVVYNYLFRMKMPKEIYIVGSSDKHSIISAAKNNGIIVNELQHGLNSDKDVILNYPFTENESLAYFPNRFFVWSNVNMFFAKLPLDERNIMKVPNYHLRKMALNLDTIEKKLGTILVISQPHGSDEILNYILRNIDSLGSYKIIYKLHPTETQTDRTRISEATKDYENITIINNEHSMYVLLREAEFVIGIYSSALFEAPVFKCKIILLNLPGVEMSFNLLQIEGCQLAEIDRSLLSLLAL